MMEPESGRRSSDREVDPLVEMRIQEVVAQTRHKLINEIAVLAANQADAALQATKEHGEVRSEIQGVRADVAGLRRDLELLLPLKDSVAALKHRDEIDDARAEVSKELLAEVREQRADARKFRLTAGGLALAAVPVLFLLGSHVQ